MSKWIPKLKYGKYAGQRMDEVPVGYLEWVIQHADRAPVLKIWCKEEYKRRGYDLKSLLEKETRKKRKHVRRQTPMTSEQILVDAERWGIDNGLIDICEHDIYFGDDNDYEQQGY